MCALSRFQRVNDVLVCVYARVRVCMCVCVCVHASEEESNQVR